MILLAADDLIKPSFIEKGVDILEKNSNVGYLHCERDYIDAEGNITELDPFYDCSFIAPGESVLPIYMLTDVGQPAQTLIRRSTFNQVFGYQSEFDHTNADKDLWFRLSVVSDYAYIREKLALIRIHKRRETTLGFKSFYHPLAIYLMVNNQARWGKLKGYQNVCDRLPAAYRKLSMECLQIAFICMQDSEVKLAGQYLIFARMICEDIVYEDKYKELMKSLHGSGPVYGEINRIEADDMFVRRKRSYRPPEGYQELEV
jgi:hypothetical protein